MHTYMATSSNIETHPWEPFLPEGAKILMLGSFPPKENRWSMDFFYPNFNNDMWRIMGLVFYGDKDRFIADAGTGSGQVRRFDKEKIIKFCSSHGIALYDTVSKARRLNDNASDKFLETVEPVDIMALLDRIPECRAVIATGEKAAGIIASGLGCDVPKTGCFVDIEMGGKSIRFYRLPSSSRAYPMSIDRKAEAYSVIKGILQY